MSIPGFPPPFVTERTAKLGYGTGPWKREELVERWGASTADKFVSDAKNAGWLVSAYRGNYHVPTAQDLMVVPWLPEPERQEFLIARTLAAGRIRSWCLSAWCRKRGLDFGAPLFVTDLRDPTAKVPKRRPDDRKRLWQDARRAAEPRSRLPFLEALVIVPRMPDLTNPSEADFALVPEASDVEARRQQEKTAQVLVTGIVQLLQMAFKDEKPDRNPVAEAEAAERRARGIPYSIGPVVEDPEWKVALLAGLGTARVEEFVRENAPKVDGLDTSRIQQWAGLIGPPQPNGRWREVIEDGPFPYLLVPPTLWGQMGADQASRRFRMLATVGGG